jgi:RNA polymerase sigma factor (sigma-70 family)
MGHASAESTPTPIRIPGGFAHGTRIMTISGEESAEYSGLTQLCLALRPQLKRFLIARGNAEADAEDMLQDLFLRLENSATGPIRSPKAYLYQMANNMAHTRRRTETRRQSREADWLDARQAGGEADAAPNQAEQLAARDELARVEAALSGLPERTAFIFRQFRVEGVSQKDIARDMGISVSAVEKHLQRAYRAVLEIRQKLETHPDPTDLHRGGDHD